MPSSKGNSKSFRISLSQALVLCILLLFAPPPGAAGRQPAPKFVVIPVYFVTDRNKARQTYGPDRKYIVNCLHDMYYGTAYQAELNDQLKVPDPAFKHLGWTGADQIKGKIARKDQIETASPEEDKKEFFKRIAATLDLSGGNHLLVFVHGAADTFENGADHAANLAYYLECPVILYSWPSTGKLRKYRIDEGNVEWSQEHYNTFLKDLEMFSEHHGVRVSLVAHSVGNRLVARSVGTMSKAEIIQDVSLVSPDIDAEIFKHYVMNYKHRGVKVRLYVSNRDKVLPFTQMLYGGYYRLGESVGSMFDIFSTTQLSLSLGLPSVPKSLSGESALEAARRLNYAQEHLEKIDFTAVDRPWIGHHFPSQLVANMILSDTPGQGLVLMPEQEGSGNKLAKFARWLNDLPPNYESSPGYCKRVVKASTLKKLPASR